jgi:cytochrome c oxidase subunit 2
VPRSLFVVGLIAWVALRYNAKSNPTPATFTNSLEVCLDDRTDRDTYFHWRVFRRFCLNSRKSRRRHQHFVTGYQWYWTYEYTDEDVFFESYMIGANGGYLNAGIIAALEEAGYSR